MWFANFKRSDGGTSEGPGGRSVKEEQETEKILSLQSYRSIDKSFKGFKDGQPQVWYLFAYTRAETLHGRQRSRLPNLLAVGSSEMRLSLAHQESDLDSSSFGYSI